MPLGTVGGGEGARRVAARRRIPPRRHVLQVQSRRNEGRRAAASSRNRGRRRARASRDDRRTRRLRRAHAEHHRGGGRDGEAQLDDRQADRRRARHHRRFPLRRRDARQHSTAAVPAQLSGHPRRQRSSAHPDADRHGAIQPDRVRARPRRATEFSLCHPRERRPRKRDVRVGRSCRSSRGGPIAAWIPRTISTSCWPSTSPGASSAGSRAASKRRSSASLSSPKFLFRIERDPPSAAPGSVYPLPDVELASRLSFFLWSSIPDDELLDLAHDGKLATPQMLKAQVARMLADPKASALVDNFAGTVALPQESRQLSAEFLGLPELRRQPAPGLQEGDRALLRQHREGRPQRRRPDDRELHVPERARRAGTTASRASTGLSSAASSSRTKRVGDCSARAAC